MCMSGWVGVDASKDVVQCACVLDWQGKAGHMVRVYRR